MNGETTLPLGFHFALPRLICRLAGKKVRQAEFSRAEAYGTGILVFAISCVFAGRKILPLVRPIWWQLLIVLALPVAIWIGWLLVYYAIALFIRPLRRFGWYSRPVNSPFQHVVITCLVTLLAISLIRDETAWMKSLGMLWLLLLALNLCSIPILRAVE